MLKPSNRVSAVLNAIWAYARQVEGLNAYLTNSMDTAVKIVRDLHEVNKGLSFHEWKENARRELVRIGDQGRYEWQEMLLNLAFETIKGESQRSWWRKLFGWVVPVKEWLTRNGLNVFVEQYLKGIVGFVSDQIKQGIGFEELYRLTFAEVKKSVPNSPDTWVAFAVNVATAVVRARTT